MEGFDFSAINYNGVVRNPGNPDDSLIVIFSHKEQRNEKLSEEYGIPHYDLVEYIKIIAPGQTEPLAFRPVSDKDKQRFASRYKAWMDGQQVPSSGYPLEQWPMVDKAMLGTLKASNLYTVQDVAAVADGNLKVLGLYGNKLRKQAQDFLAQAEGLAPLTKMRAEMESLQSKYNALISQNEMLIAQMKEMGVPLSSEGTYVPQISVKPSLSEDAVKKMIQDAVAGALANKDETESKKKAKNK